MCECVNVLVGLSEGYDSVTVEETVTLEVDFVLATLEVYFGASPVEG